MLEFREYLMVIQARGQRLNFNERFSPAFSLLLCGCFWIIGGRFPFCLCTVCQNMDAGIAGSIFPRFYLGADSANVSYLF